MGFPASTLEGVRAADEGPAPRWGRRVGIAVLLVIVVIGALGFLGVHSRTVGKSANGYTMEVTYPQVARAGLDVPWRVHVHSGGGFTASITIAISQNYLRIFETQGFFPTPDSMTANGNFVYFTFSKPSGTDFVLDYDTYIQPAQQVGKPATVQLLVHNVVMVQTHLKTWLLP